jgi:hypothetical protein
MRFKSGHWSIDLNYEVAAWLPPRAETGEAAAAGAALGIAKSAEKRYRPLSESGPLVRPPDEPTPTKDIPS